MHIKLLTIQDFKATIWPATVSLGAPCIGSMQISTQIQRMAGEGMGVYVGNQLRSTLL